ncbi:MAG: hypothetical protein ACLQDF_14165 [Desulfomonilia bacterium]
MGLIFESPKETGKFGNQHGQQRQRIGYRTRQKRCLKQSFLFHHFPSSLRFSNDKKQELKVGSLPMYHRFQKEIYAQDHYILK